MSVANHLAAIRSFLIVSGPPTASRAQFYAKYFCAVNELKLLAKNDGGNAGANPFCLIVAKMLKNAADKKSLFHRIIFNAGNFVAKLPRNGA